MKRAVLSCFLLLICLTATAGKLYKWKDANGKIHFTQKAPPPDAVPIAKTTANGSSNAVESRWPKEMQQNARDFMNRAGVRRVWVNRDGEEVKSQNRY